MKTNLYVAYGSNMNLNQMKYRCPKSKPIGKAYLHGYELVFNYHADVIPTGNPNDVVPVALWEIDPTEWKRLDMYEGYPRYYIRETVTVKTEDGKEVEAIVYVMAKDRKGRYAPSADYFYGIVEGCKDFGIPTDHLRDALKKSVHNPTEFNQYNPCTA